MNNNKTIDRLKWIKDKHQQYFSFINNYNELELLFISIFIVLILDLFVICIISFHPFHKIINDFIWIQLKKTFLISVLFIYIPWFLIPLYYHHYIVHLDDVLIEIFQRVEIKVILN